ncbi:vacuolar H+/Ca2+ exchanger [Ophiocordyceps camponoti-floridani]|uniref:Vacuolar H+/Ca2+ exchanger n=1 Tax=Ophiocordyceps camponoti-floridani TaxID=2030778 RepID=A0A8H4Q0V6_9HYPO|nr:vacuolar H+/Ca2+ exchanger [Ophiocordyceps camponoti-floridani]
MAARDHAHTLLLKAARHNGLQLGKDELRLALERSDFVQWANKHLGPENLLTADELAVYSALDRSGRVDQLASQHELAHVQAVSDDHLRAAIEDLSRSTEKMLSQARSLRIQRDALSRLAAEESDGVAARGQLCRARQHEDDGQRRRLAADVDELSTDVRFRLSDIEQQCRDSTPRARELVRDMLKSDDRLLAGFQKLCCELDKPVPEDEVLMERLRKTCARLARVTVDTARARLDRIYIDTIVATGRSRTAADEDDVAAIKEEVESLFSEMLPVAHMSIDRQHIRPALDSIAARSGMSMNRTAEALTYMDGCLDVLVKRMDRLRTRLVDVESLHHAAADMTFLAETELAVATSPEPSTATMLPGSPPKKTSPVRRTPLTTRNEAPLDLLLQNLSLPAMRNSNMTSTQQNSFLSRAVTERRQKAAEVARGAQESFETSVVAHLSDAKLAIQLLEDSLLADSPFADVNLSDPELETSILVLDQEIGKADAVFGRMTSFSINSRAVAGDTANKVGYTEDKLPVQTRRAVVGKSQ